MTPLDDLRSNLELGLHQKSVQAMLKISRGLAQKAQEPLAFYVLASVFGDLDSKWSGRPVESSQTAAAERELLPRLRQLVFGIQRQAPVDEVVASMNLLLTCFIELQDSGELG